MRQLLFRFAFAAVVFVVSVSLSRAADNYEMDAMHTAVGFRISHLGLSWTMGRFNTVSGAFTIDPTDAGKCTFEMAIKTESIDTGNAKRDEHLRSPDFLNVRQFPQMSFKSSAVEAAKDGYTVTGDLTLHGVTKAVKFTLVGGRKAEFPKGVQRTGYSTELVLKRSDFGMDKMKEAIGDEVQISISFEGTIKP
jgi:polyisoprenoid-binding protein YceI